MKYLFQFMKLPDDLDVSKLSADEVHFKSVKLERKNLFSKFHDIKFITNLICTKASKILFNAPGRDSVALEDCLSILTDEQKELKALRKQLEDITEERDILKKVVSIFSVSDRKNTTL